MPVALQTADTPDVSSRRRTIRITATLSGNYTTGGDTMNFLAVANPGMFSGGTPRSNSFVAEVINSPLGYDFEPVKGSGMNNWLLKCYSGNGTELAAGPYPAPLLADPVILKIEGRKGIY